MSALSFTIVLQAEPRIDAIRNLRIALKVLKRRYGLRVSQSTKSPSPFASHMSAFDPKRTCVSFRLFALALRCVWGQGR
jgi:hypothetical protein